LDSAQPNGFRRGASRFNGAQGETQELRKVLIKPPHCSTMALRQRAPLGIFVYGRAAIGEGSGNFSASVSACCSPADRSTICRSPVDETKTG